MHEALERPRARQLNWKMRAKLRDTVIDYSGQ
jgi:hypothetical protein